MQVKYQAQIFFGNRNEGLDFLKENFKQFVFLRLKQTHSDVIHEVNLDTPDFVQEGDALITQEKNLALCSISADCVPILVSDSATGKIAAVHAGWRGVAKRILPKTLIKMGIIDASETLKIMLGPHIQMSSFDVHEDVANEILASIQLNIVTAPNNISAIMGSGKYRLNLQEILWQQVKIFMMNQDQFVRNSIDTKTNLNYHSARRDQQSSGRNISWIVMSN